MNNQENIDVSQDFTILSKGYYRGNRYKNENNKVSVHFRFQKDIYDWLQSQSGSKTDIVETALRMMMLAKKA